MSKRKHEHPENESANLLQNSPTLSSEAAFGSREAPAALKLLHESNQTLQAVIQASPLAIITLDTQGLIRMWNPAAERIYGWSASEVIGRKLPTVPPEQEAEVQSDHQDAVQGKIFSNYETKRLRKDGRLIDVSISTAPLLDEDGRSNGVVAIVADITERKQVEETLRRWERIFQHAGWGVAIANAADNTLHAANPAFAKMHGYTLEEMIGMPIIELFAPESRNELAGHLRVSQEQGHHTYESWHIRKDGTRFPTLTDTTAFKDEHGKVIYRAANFQDISERRRIEEAQKFLSDATTLLASSLDYEQILEQLARLAVPYLADCCLVDMLDENGTIRRMVVAHQDPAKEQAWHEMQRRFPLDPDASYTIPKVLRTGEPELYAEIDDTLFETVLTDQEHIAALKQFNIKSSLIVPLTARGRTRGALSFIITDSDRRYGADDLSLAQELARRAALAIDNARLYRRAQEANRAKDEFLATLSHELRTPLTPIIGWIHMMRSGRLDAPDITRGLDVINKNSQSLAHLINDLLDMSAILSGKMRIDHIVVPLDAVIKEAIETVRPLAMSRNIRLEFALACTDNQTMNIFGDRTRLVQVFWNLLNNAVKFSRDHGRVRVVCETDANEVRVHIEDEGEGIEPEFLPYVFERFRQADMSTTKAYGGLGIGLALVKSFVEAHGGAVEAASAGRDRGSRFTVSLPRLHAGATAELKNVSAGQAMRTPAPRPLHVLIIEDAPDTLEMLRLSFMSQGYEVTACAAAAEALEVALDECFDIIISDIGLPHIDGFELIKRLRERASHLCDVPAVALTGYATERDVEAALAAGYAAHIAKPIDPATLIKVVNQLFEGRKSEPKSGESYHNMK